MRKATRGEWAAHAPATNCLWLSYLADTLLSRKRVPADAAAKRDLRGFRCVAWATLAIEGCCCGVIACS